MDAANLDTGVIGVGGECGYYHEEAIIVFGDENDNPIGFKLFLGIQYVTNQIIDNEEALSMPNLLGRDIINRGTFHYFPSRVDSELIFDKDRYELY